MDARTQRVVRSTSLQAYRIIASHNASSAYHRDKSRVGARLHALDLGSSQPSLDFKPHICKRDLVPILICSLRTIAIETLGNQPQSYTPRFCRSTRGSPTTKRHTSEIRYVPALPLVSVRSCRDWITIKSPL
jgi:hypothetical protein